MLGHANVKQTSVYLERHDPGTARAHPPIRRGARLQWRCNDAAVKPPPVHDDNTSVVPKALVNW